MDVVVRRLFVTILIVGAPLLLAAVELFHPHPDDLLRLDIKSWLIVHYAQILLFPLSAVAMVLLVRGWEDIWAILCRITMFIFAASYAAFDTAAGVVTSILVNAAQTSGMPEAWRAPIDAVWTHPVVLRRRKCVVGDVERGSHASDAKCITHQNSSPGSDGSFYFCASARWMRSSVSGCVLK